VYQQGRSAGALVLHQKAALAEQLIQAGIAATKYVAAIHSASYAEIVNAAALLRLRRPYSEPAAPIKEEVKATMAEVAMIYQTLGSCAEPSARL
jgi:4-hydroxy-2-oxoglutarate aldolase